MISFASLGFRSLVLLKDESLGRHLIEVHKRIFGEFGVERGAIYLGEF